MRYIGLDVHRDYCHGYEFEPGQKGRHFRFPNTPDAWEHYAASLDQLCHVALEVTGNAFTLYDTLSPRAGKVVLVDPRIMTALRGRRRKSDRDDAKLLAERLALGTLPTVYAPPQPIRELRQLLNLRDALVCERTRHMNQVRAVIRRLNLQSEAPRRLFSKKGMAWLLNRPLPAGEAIAVRTNLHLVQTLDAQIQQLEGEIAHRVQDTPEVRLLLSIPGVGLITAAAVYAAVGDIQRFRSAKQLASYFGLTPRVYQSGVAHYSGRLSKAGPATVRRCLIEAAHVLITRCPVENELVRFYHRVKHRRGHHKALCALAHKLTVIIWAILTHAEAYREMDPPKFRIKLRKRLLAVAKPYPFDLASLSIFVTGHAPLRDDTKDNFEDRGCPAA